MNVKYIKIYIFTLLNYLPTNDIIPSSFLLFLTPYSLLLLGSRFFKEFWVIICCGVWVLHDVWRSSYYFPYCELGSILLTTLGFCLSQNFRGSHELFLVIFEYRLKFGLCYYWLNVTTSRPSFIDGLTLRHKSLLKELCFPLLL